MSERAQRAEALFCEGYNCAQAALAAFCYDTHISQDMALRLMSSFGGGMGVCVRCAEH